MKLYYKLILTAIFAALLLSSCTQPPAPVSAPSSVSSATLSSAEASSEVSESSSSTAEEEPDIIEQIDKLYAELETSPIPQLEHHLWSNDIDLAAGTPDSLPPQLVRDEPKSYALAQVIRTVLYPEENIPSDFDRIEDAYQPALLQTALYHTASLDLNWNWNSDTREFSASSYRNHAVTALLKNELEEGRSPSNVFAGDDVRTTLRRLYGDIEMSEMDVTPYYYYAREDVFLQMGDWDGPMWRYPQITAYKESDDGVVCEAVLIWAQDRATPLQESGVPLTSQNFDTATAKCPKYQYTFRRAPDDDRLILSGFKILRKGAEA